MKYVYYGLAGLAFVQTLLMSIVLGNIITNPVGAVLMPFLYGAVSGRIAGNLIVLGRDTE